VCPSDVITQVIRGAKLEFPGIELRVLRGIDRGKNCKLTPVGVRIGTAGGNHLRLTDPTVSRLHCELRVVDGAIRITDSGSTNGTYVDDVRVGEAQVRLGAVLRVGETVLGLSAGPELASVELSPRHSFGGVIGASTEMRRLYAVLEKVAPTESAVLLLGETGTGKELVARAIHDASPRAKNPFVVVDCGSIAENLIESELFGHVRGAFSGAHSDRCGLFEEASGGTLFLDEIGELPPALQPRLLRVLETREVRRVGANANRRVDVRILAATKRPLAKSVNDGTFRDDLYYRLAVVEIELPPLRARRDDLPLLAEAFYRRYAGESETPPPELVSSLTSRAWPGNVRELRNFIERTVSLGYTAPSDAAPRGAAPEGLVPIHLPLKDARAAWTEQFELLYVKALLKKTVGNVTRAAELAGVNRRSLQRLIVSLGVRDGGRTEGGGGGGGDASSSIYPPTATIHAVFQCGGREVDERAPGSSASELRTGDPSSPT
jgi:DNA-binding NtrC family response regulator